MDYRQIYENYYGKKIKEGYEVHHIDFNHDNDNPENLVLLPIELHRRLHEKYNIFLRMRDNFGINDIKLHSGKCNNHSNFMNSLYDYISVIEECVIYMNERNYARMEKLNNDF